MTDHAGVATEMDRDMARATGVVAASPAEVFDMLRHPANHAGISGDGSVRGITDDDEPLVLGSRFGMRMRVGVPYRIHSTVVEFEEDRLIAWAHFAGHRWRWELEPTTDGSTRISETFDMTTAKFPPALRLMGYPKRHRDNVATSVANLIAHFA